MRRINKKEKRIVVLLLSIMLILAMTPIMVFADFASDSDEGSEDQIGNYYEVGENGTIEEEPKLGKGMTEKSYEDGKVKVNKTIKSTEKENVFDVTLCVSTQEMIDHQISSPDAATVLVIDVSGSMEGDKISSAKQAAQKFINKFADAAGADRKIAIVKFSGDSNIDGARTVCQWTDAKKLARKGENFCPELEALKAKGGTNTEAGMILGRNLLNKLSEKEDTKNITNKNIVLLTDGKPTYGVEKDDEKSTEVVCEAAWWFNSNQEGDGTDTTCVTHKDVETITKNLKTEGIGTYAVYVGNDSVNCKTCTLNKPGAKWLAENCEFSTFAANNVNSLTGIFEKIVNLINLKAKAWIVTDPMGDNIRFKEFLTEPDAINEFTIENETITWDIKKCARGQESTEGNVTTTTYTMKYRIELNTLAEGFEGNKSYPTNKLTSLTYLILKDQQEENENLLKTAYFNIPSVKGYVGELTFEKQFEGEDNNENLRASFTLKTTDDTNFSKTESTDGNGNIVFSNIPSGHTYTLQETSTPGGYAPAAEKHVTVSHGKVTTDIENSIIVNKKISSNFTTIKVNKEWVDNNNQDGIRPASVTAVVKGDDIEKKVILSEENDWLGTVSDLPINDTNGKPIAYTVKEENVPKGYEATVCGNATNGFTITNTHTPETITVSGFKTWDDSNNQDGKRPESITIHLWNGNKKVDSKIVSAKTDWRWSFSNLPKKENGTEITYTITEDEVTGYSSEVNDYNVTNSYTPGKTSVTVQKTWDDGNNRDGIRPENITVNLLANGDDIGKEIVLNEGNGWSGTFADLAINSNGEPIQYSVSENPVQGYETKISQASDGGNSFIITNIHRPKPIDPPKPTYKSFSVEKIWKLDDGGIQADFVKVQLMRDNQVYGDPIELSRANNWKHTWYGLSYGYRYSVVELDVPDNFTASIEQDGNKAVITNDDIKQEKPTDPENPDKPDKPDKPEKPDKPSKPDNSDTVDTVDETDGDVPKTGDMQNISLWIGLLFTTLGALGVTLCVGRKEKGRR